MTREEARLIAQELHKLIRKDIVEQISKITSEAIDRTLTLQEVSQRLGCSPKTVYNKISDIPHQKVGSRLIFSERAIAEYINSKARR